MERFAIRSTDIMSQPLKRILGVGDNWGQIILQLKRHHVPPARGEWNSQQPCAINLVLQGSGRYLMSNGKAFPLGPGTLYHSLGYPGAEVEFETQQSVTEIFLVLDAGTAGNLRRLSVLNDEPVVQVGCDPAILNGFRRLRSVCELSYHQMTKRRILSELLQFLQLIYDPAVPASGVDSMSRALVNAARQLREDSTGSLTIPEVAAACGISYTSLRRAFVLHMGISPVRFRLYHRMRHAALLLRGHTVSEVAALLEYADPFVFSAQFKRVFGMPPKTFQSLPPRQLPRARFEPAPLGWQ